MLVPTELQLNLGSKHEYQYAILSLFKCLLLETGVIYNAGRQRIRLPLLQLSTTPEAHPQRRLHILKMPYRSEVSLLQVRIGIPFVLSRRTHIHRWVPRTNSPTTTRGICKCYHLQPIPQRLVSQERRSPVKHQKAQKESQRSSG